MRILLITDSYPPEVRSASHLMGELAENFKKLGHEVTVLTSYPAYNLADENISLSQVEDEEGVRVIRVKTPPHHKVNFIFRGIAQLALPFIFFRAAKRLVKDIDVIFIHTPPLPLALATIHLKEIFHARFVLNVHDIFPQNAVDLNILNNKLLIRFFERMESRVYRAADVIIVPSIGHREFLEQKRFVPAKKITVVPHWIDISQFDNVRRTGKFREKFGIASDKFIFLFGGILGPSQGLDFVLDVAERVKDIPEALFLFVGDGTAKDKLERTAKRKNLGNVLFKPLVSKGEYPFLVKDADVGLVCLTSRNKTPIFPAKIPAYMAAKIPILAFVNKESLHSTLIEEADCGFVLTSENLAEAAKAVRKMFKNGRKTKQLGENGYRYAKKNLNAVKAAGEIASSFNIW